MSAHSNTADRACRLWNHRPVLDFLGKVPDVGWAALISSVATAVTLMVQTFLTNRRDDRRRGEDAIERQRERVFQADQAAAERNHQENLASESRLEARADAWRLDRREAHALLFVSLQAYRAGAAKVLSWAEVDSDGHLTQGKGQLDIASDQEREDLKSRWAEIQLLASDEARRRGRIAVDQAFNLELDVWIASTISRGRGEEHKAAKLRAQMMRLAGAIDSYVDAVRDDLGTSG